MAREPRGEIVCGRHAVLAALEKGRITRLLLVSGRKGEEWGRIRELAERAGLPIEERPVATLDELASTRQHQGLVAQAHPLKMLSLEELLARQSQERPPLMLLDGIQDPRNLGAILRTAAALGAGGVLWPKDGAVGLTATVAKAASGALEGLNLARVTNMARAVLDLKSAGYWTIAGDPEGELALGESEMPVPAALVIGAEGRGIRRLVRKNCDLGVRISLTKGIVSSLNAAVAAGILLHALVTQRSH